MRKMGTSPSSSSSVHMPASTSSLHHQITQQRKQRQGLCMLAGAGAAGAEAGVAEMDGTIARSTSSSMQTLQSSSRDGTVGTSHTTSTRKSSTSTSRAKGASGAVEAAGSADVAAPGVAVVVASPGSTGLGAATSMQAASLQAGRVQSMKAGSSTHPSMQAGSSTNPTGGSTTSTNSSSSGVRRASMRSTRSGPTGAVEGGAVGAVVGLEGTSSTSSSTHRAGMTPGDSRVVWVGVRRLEIALQGAAGVMHSAGSSTEVPAGSSGGMTNSARITSSTTPSTSSNSSRRGERVARMGSTSSSTPAEVGVAAGAGVGAGVAGQAGVRDLRILIAVLLMHLLLKQVQTHGHHQQQQRQLWVRQSVGLQRVLQMCGLCQGPDVPGAPAVPPGAQDKERVPTAAQGLAQRVLATQPSGVNEAPATCSRRVGLVTRRVLQEGVGVVLPHLRALVGVAEGAGAVGAVAGVLRGASRVGRAVRVPLFLPVGRGMRAPGVGAGVVGAVAGGHRGALRVGRVVRLPLYPTVARGTRAAGGGVVGDAAGLGVEGVRAVLHPSSQQQSLPREP